MRVIDLGDGQEEYNDEIYDRRGGGRRSRRSNGTYMGYEGGIYDHFGKDHEEQMREVELRERELERRERMLEEHERKLEERLRRHEREDEMYRRGWFGERDIHSEYDGDGVRMRVRRGGRGGGRYY